MATKIEMRDDNGSVTEVVEKVHVCEGNLFHCQSPAQCEECGAMATQERLVYVWTDSRGIGYFACERCLEGDPYAKVVREFPSGPDSTHAEVASLVDDGDPMNSDPAYLAWCAEQEKLCHAEYSTGGSDPYGTECRLEKGHDGKHEGADPFGGEGVVRWLGGGSCAGDALPYREVEGIEKATKPEAESHGAMSRMAIERCSGGEEAHVAHLQMNGECPWCGAWINALGEKYGQIPWTIEH